MDCNFSTIDGIARCVLIGKPWIELALGLAGLGGLAAVSALIWTIKHWRSDRVKWQNDNERLARSASDAERASRLAVGERDLANQQRDLAVSAISGDLSAQQEEIAKAQYLIKDLGARVDAVRAVRLGDSAAFWSRPAGPLPQFDTEMQNSIPVTMFANQKGGVGKTTLTTNIAACWAEQRQRVLAIDLDYQGSLTNLMLAQAAKGKTEFASKVDHLFQRPLNEHWPAIAIESVPTCDKLHYIPTGYSFERLERALEYSWVIGDEPEDVRFLLRRVILSNYVQTHYDRVVVDAPPRVTLGFVNGLVCSTHLFVPTVVDMTSAAAVGLFAQQFQQLRAALNPYVSFRGIIGTMTNVEHLAKEALPAANAAERAAQLALNTNDGYFLRDAVMRRDAKVSYSTEAGIAYLQEPSTRPMFKRIADEIARRAPSKRS